MQTDLTMTQERFLEEISGLIAMINRRISVHDMILSDYRDIKAVMSRIEDKIDLLEPMLRNEMQISHKNP